MLDVDACYFGVGPVLLQVGSAGQDGTVAYFWGLVLILKHFEVLCVSFRLSCCGAQGPQSTGFLSQVQNIKPKRFQVGTRFIVI